MNGPSNPATTGSIVAIWGTGFGPTDPSCATGGLNVPKPANLASGPVDIFDGMRIPVEYAGSAPTQLCGVVQINMRVPMVLPPTVPAGTFLFSAGGSNFVTIAVK